MEAAPRRLFLYIAASVDGFIAGPGEDLSFLDSVQAEGEDYGYGEFIASVDTVIIGRKTYDWVSQAVGEFPHKDKTTFVITRTEKPAEGKVNFYAGDLTALVNELKSLPGKNIFCDGGAQVVNELLKLRLIDEIILSVVPVMIGEGTRLFGDDNPKSNWKLKNLREFPSGLVQIHYVKK